MCVIERFFAALLGQVLLYGEESALSLLRDSVEGFMSFRPVPFNVMEIK